MNTSEPNRSADCDIEAFYDGACPICVSEVRFLRILDTKRRILFDFGNAFLDSWFGIEKLHDKMMESKNKKESLP